jgi:hypothetical protein
LCEPIGCVIEAIVEAMNEYHRSISAGRFADARDRGAKPRLVDMLS